MEKRSDSRHEPDGALACTVEWEQGQTAGRIHNISPRGALLESKNDFGISNVKLILQFDSTGDTLQIDASIRWHAVSPQNESDHYGLVFRSIDESTQEKLNEIIKDLANRS